MWHKSYAKEIQGITVEELWDNWTDINNWHKWQSDIDLAEITEDFKPGTFFKFKPKGGPTMKLELTEVNKPKIFTDVTHFPLAKMYDKHEIIEQDGKIILKITTSIDGLLSFVWRKIVAEGVAKGQSEQIENLIEYIKRKKSQ